MGNLSFQSPLLHDALALGTPACSGSASADSDACDCSVCVSLWEGGGEEECGVGVDCGVVR